MVQLESLDESHFNVESKLNSTEGFLQPVTNSELTGTTLIYLS